MKRKVQPEILDSLPFNHSDAQKNRRDLRTINQCFRSYPWFLDSLQNYGTMAPALEVGAGDGGLSRFLHQEKFQIDGLDLAPMPSGWPHEQTWWQNNLLSFPHWKNYPILLGNLILHQFKEDQLKMLGEHFKDARLLIFNEPLRSRFHQIAFQGFASLMRMNHVSRHDGDVSIEAGFRGDELPTLLGLNNSFWRWNIQYTITGFYHCIGVRL